MEIPLVSVLMTAYNREKFISEAIESVLASTYSNFELIIVDDCSVDNTLAIVKKMAALDSRIKFYINEKNLGDYPNRNRAASYAVGKYLKYVDADDQIKTDGLAYCVGAMEAAPHAGLGMLQLPVDESKDIQYLEPGEVVKKHFFVQQCLTISPSGTIIRNDLFKKLRGFDTRFGVASDMYFNLKYASVAPVIFLPKVFFFYRRHEGQEINNPFSYLKFGYLYQREIFAEQLLPLPSEKIQFLKKKNVKRFAVNYFRTILKSTNRQQVKGLLKELSLNEFDLVKSLFY
ncbi:MAG: glycosyltransferase family 2 protein [Ferruginibacter sp.]|nr:glycosyltransferase family 2 protein [Ferruginibacter sp.]